MLERAAMLHFGAEEESRLAADIAPRVSRAVVPNGLDWDAFGALPDGAGFRERRLGGHRGPVVMHFGRITRKKGVDVLIEAFARSGPQEACARLAIVGPDDEGLVPRLVALARAEGVDSLVDFVGPVYGEERLEALAAADVWALASRADACATAVMEAFAASRATILSPAVNLSVEAEREDAAIVAPLDPNELGRQLAALIGDEQRRTELGNNARQFARRFDRLEVARRMLGVYEEVAA
jgi:glycosyltransferase involved in cell wall biosynthesis